jgi:hypothetical protein
MYEMSHGQFKAILFGLAVMLAGGLLGTTFILSRISSWVVSDDALNGRMDGNGGFLEHMVAELVHSESGVDGIFVIVLICCGVFLVLLWHALFGKFDVRR